MNKDNEYGDINCQKTKISRSKIEYYTRKRKKLIKKRSNAICKKYMFELGLIYGKTDVEFERIIEENLNKNIDFMNGYNSIKEKKEKKLILS